MAFWFACTTLELGLKIMFLFPCRWIESDCKNFFITYSVPTPLILIMTAPVGEICQSIHSDIHAFSMNIFLCILIKFHSEERQSNLSGKLYISRLCSVTILEFRSGKKCNVSYSSSKYQKLASNECYGPHEIHNLHNIAWI